MKTDLIKQFNLPPYVKGKSFSQASEAIQKKFKDRNDKYASDTKEELLSRLSQAQEYIKMQESLKNESQQVPDQMNGEIPEGMEQFMPQGEQPQQGQMAMGGKVNKYVEGGQAQQMWNANGAIDTADNTKFKIRGTTSNTLGVTPMDRSRPDASIANAETPDTGVTGAGVVGAAGTALDLGKTAFGPSGIDTSGRTAAPDVQSRGMGAATGALKGAAAGASFGPLGLAIGGVVGAGAGLLGAGKAKKDAQEAGAQYTLGQNAEYRQSDFAFGGQVNKFDGITNPSSWLKKPRVNPNVNFDKIDLDLGNMKSSTGDWDASTNGATTLEQDSSKLDSAKALVAGDRTSGTEKTGAGQALDWLGKNAGNIAQYAPVASNLLALKNLKKGTTDRGARLDRVYQPQQFDEAQLINQINQDNTPAALRESAGGDLGALRQSLLGADINKKKALSQGMAAAAEVERGENQYAYQTGAQKDQVNAQLEGDYINRRAQDVGAFESTKAKLQRQIAEDAGAIGREEVDKKLVKEMFGYKWNGKYFIDKDGKVVPNDVVAAKIASTKDTEATNVSQYGGYLKK